jgi:RHS repeat-associated protein
MNNKLLEEKAHDTDNSEVYDYDSAYRVTKFNRGTLSSDKTSISTGTDTPNQLQSQTWDLDGVNNWNSTDHTTGGTTNTESRDHTDYNEIEQVSGTTYGDENTGTHQLDKNGNITDDNKRELKYDAFNRVKEVIRKSDGQTVAEYTYDSMNRRFRKVVSNSGIDGNDTNGTTEYFYKDWQTIEEQDGSGNPLRQYVYGRYIDEPLTLDDRSGGQTVADLNDDSGDDRLFYHCNTQYSTFALTDETGSIVEGYQYDAYGRQTVIRDPGSDGEWFTDDDTLEVNGDSAVDNPYMFQGRRFDSETKLHYYRNRYYNSRLGRFISRDPMGVWYDIMDYGNGYAGFYLNPSSKFDFLGLQVSPEHAGGARRELPRPTPRRDRRHRKTRSYPNIPDGDINEGNYVWVGSGIKSGIFIGIIGYASWIGIVTNQKTRERCMIEVQCGQFGIGLGVNASANVSVSFAGPKEGESLETYEPAGSFFVEGRVGFGVSAGAGGQVGASSPGTTSPRGRTKVGGSVGGGFGLKGSAGVQKCSTTVEWCKEPCDNDNGDGDGGGS